MFNKISEVRNFGLKKIVTFLTIISFYYLVNYIFFYLNNILQSFIEKQWLEIFAIQGNFYSLIFSKKTCVVIFIKKINIINIYT